MTFEERYKKLNPEQKRAVDMIDGPVMVIAGPGTGKTEILTLRIANILKKTDTAPENILALTFTDAASGNMRKRLGELIGPSAYRLSIKTFHSFCNDIIGTYPEYFPKIIGSSPITEVESAAILEEIIQSLPLTLLRPWGDPFFYLRSMAGKIEELKREGFSPEAFAELLSTEEKNFTSRDDLYHEKGAHKGKMKGEYLKQQKKLVKNKELQTVYAAYQKVLAERRLYDWSDMIMEVLAAVSENAELKLILQESHQYILVDEHQDTNNAQNKILELLSDFHQSPNIFIVGDEKQAIFRFQGASVENFLRFKKLYPTAERIELSTNYRSGQSILDAAHSLLSSNTPLTAFKKDQAFVHVAAFEKPQVEERFVAEHIQKLVKGGTPPEEVAVIYRSNREAFSVAGELDRLGISYTIESDEDLLSENFVRKFLITLDAIRGFGRDELLAPLLHLSEFGLEPLSVYTLLRKASESRTKLYDLVKESDDEKLKNIFQKLSDWAVLSKSEEVTKFLENVLRESGLLSAMIESKDASAFLGIERLFTEAKRISTSRAGAMLEDFMEFIDLVRNHKLFLRRPKHAVSKAVRLMTAHRAKGLEFAEVCIIHVTDRSFGPKADREKLPLVESVYNVSADDEEENAAENDERRLFYVALTRAKRAALITYSTTDDSGRETLASPFILEIREDRKSIIDTSEWQEKLSENREVLYGERQAPKTTALDEKFVAELFYSHPLSVSALNNYLSCPWKYFYRNLLRLPSAPERHQIYGTAMHGAVEDMWRVAIDRGLDKQYLLDAYERHLGRLGLLSAAEYEEALTRGKTALSGWFDWREPVLTNPIISEFSIPGVELTPSLILSGKLDKVEIVGPKKFIVTDYKTGGHKSRNEIEGLTGSSSGDIKRQLIFYKLLLGLHDGTEMTEGVIEFLEPDRDTGKYRSESFIVADTEVAELKEIIKKVANEITTLAFWDKKCDDKECQYCAYREILKK